MLRQGKEVKPLSGNTGEKEREDEGSWEFVPAKVPNGISLRNFGIQVVSSFFSSAVFLFSMLFSLFVFPFFFSFSVWMEG